MDKFTVMNFAFFSKIVINALNIYFAKMPISVQ